MWMINVAKDNLFEIVNDLNNDGGKYTIADLEKAIEEYNLNVDTVVKYYNDTEYKHITIEDIHLKTASYKWMKQYLKTHEMSFVNYTVYYAIKHNLSEEEAKDYFRQQAEKGIKKLMNQGTCGRLNFVLTPNIRKMFPNIHDELFDTQVYTSEDSWKDKNDPNRYRPVYKLNKKNMFNHQLTYGDLQLDCGQGSYHKSYILDSNIHPIKIHLTWSVSHQCLGREKQIELFVKCCFAMFQIIKRLDSDKELAHPERTVDKKLSNWVRPMTPKEKVEKDKKDSMKKLNKGERKMLDKIKRLGLSEIFKKLL